MAETLFGEPHKNAQRNIKRLQLAAQSITSAEECFVKGRSMSAKDKIAAGLAQRAAAPHTTNRDDVARTRR